MPLFQLPGLGYLGQVSKTGTLVRTLPRLQTQCIYMVLDFFSGCQIQGRTRGMVCGLLSLGVISVSGL